MATVIEEFVARLGWDVDTKEVEKFNKSFDRVKNIALGIGKAVSIATGLITGYATVVGRQIAINTNLAASVGLSVEALEALGGVVENLGMDTERVVDLVEEMNNKFGEKKGLGEFTAVEESLKILRLDFEAIKKLQPEEQFIKILDAAKELGDQQEAASAVDMLMGGEANKILGFLRTQEGTLAELIDRRKQLILLDADGRQGAVEFAAAMNDVNFMLKSMGGLIFGALGKVLRPMIQNFLDWAAANRDVVRSQLQKFAAGLAKFLGALFKILKTVVTWIWKTVEAVGGLDKAFFLLSLTVGAFALSNIIIGISHFIKAVRAATIAQTLFNASVALIPLLIALAIVAVGLIAEDFYQFFTGGESVVGDFVEFVKGVWKEMVDYTEGLIGQMVASWAEAWGVSKEEMDGALLASYEALEEFFRDVDKQILAIFEYFMGFGGGFGDFIDGLIDKAVGMFRDLKIIAKDSIGAIIEFARGIPLIGRLFGGETKITGGGGAGSGAPSTPGPSPSSSIVNSRGNTNNTQSIKIEAPIKIEAGPGQSPADIGREVRRQLGEQMSVAVRNNDTGIER